MRRVQAQQQIRINAAPLTAALVLFATLVLGGFGGYAIGTALRSPAAVPSTRQAAPHLPAAQQLPASAPIFEEGRMCTADFKFCREPQNSYD
jgi:hypothetical protein